MELGLRLIGLLGGIGSGKSTAARALAAALPAAVLDADAEVAALLQDSAVVARIEAEFGPGLAPAGVLDRAALGRRVFADPSARRRLEELLHPGVRRALHGKLAALEASGTASFVILDVPLLLENGLDAVCDFLVYVDVPAPERARRAGARHGWSIEQWQARENAQLPVAEKAARADAILDNARGLERLHEQIPALVARLRQLRPRPLRERWPFWDRLPARPDRPR